MTQAEATVQARQHWARLMGAGGAQDRAPGEAVAADLPAPTGLAAHGGSGQVTLTWDPVPGAIGYVVHRAAECDGRYQVVDHGGGDVLAVPHPPYADTTGTPGRRYWYAVAPLATINAMGPLSTPVAGTPTLAGTPVPASGSGGSVPAASGSVPAGGSLPAASGSLPAGGGGAGVRVRVAAGGDAGALHRPWQAMVGCEHLSHLLSTDTTGGRPIGAELRAALRRVHDELGVASVRAHAILGDDLGVYREIAGEPWYDFTGVDRVYDAVRQLGMRPVVELSYLPRDLARDPTRTVFAYQAVVSPPKDWDRWSDLIRAFTAHLVNRYGRAEVRDHWLFEVWNEANLSVFWTGTPAEYWRLYDCTARAVKDVDPGIRVGGPASAAVGWIDDQLATAAPLDFLSTHTYGSPPLDLRPLATAHGRGDLPVVWTEWGVTATHGSHINDTVFAATFLLHGMRSASRRVAALTPWVASDHFEELGRPTRLLHGGFGLLTIGNLAKPKYWALALAQRLGDTELPASVTGDGAGSLVAVWAARSATGQIGVLVWNGALDHARVGGDPALDRRVSVQVDGLADCAYTVRQWRVDATHSNLEARWRAMGGGDWPDEEQWRQLAAADRPDELAPHRVRPALPERTVQIEVDLPMPAISYLEFQPIRPSQR